MKITIWSDFVCPFCYIGEAHLKKALSNFEKDDNIEIEYRSFQLDPEGHYIDNLTYVETFAKLKGVSIDQAQSMTSRVQEMAQEAGLSLDYDKALYSNTFDAHRVFQLAKEKGLGNEYFNRFYRAHFVDGLNIEDKEVIFNLAQEVGLDDEEVKDVLDDTTEFEDRVEENINQAASIGVQGVPFFVFDEKYGVSGAQPVELFENVLERVHSESER